MTDVQRPPEVTPAATDSAPSPEADPDRSVGQLMADMTSEISTLMRKEVELAIVELKDEAMQAAKAGGMLTGAALNGYFALLFASFSVAWYLDRKMRRPKAFFLVAAMHGAAAAALLNRGRIEMQQVDPVPQQTVETLKENVDWVKAQAG